KPDRRSGQRRGTHRTCHYTRRRSRDIVTGKGGERLPHTLDGYSNWLRGRATALSRAGGCARRGGDQATGKRFRRRALQVRRAMGARRRRIDRRPSCSTASLPLVFRSAFECLVVTARKRYYGNIIRRSDFPDSVVLFICYKRKICFSQVGSSAFFDA